MDSRNDRQRQTNKIKGNTEEHTFVAQELEKIYGWEVNEEALILKGRISRKKKGEKEKKSSDKFSGDRTVVL